MFLVPLSSTSKIDFHSEHWNTHSLKLMLTSFVGKSSTYELYQRLYDITIETLRLTGKNAFAMRNLAQRKLRKENQTTE